MYRYKLQTDIASLILWKMQSVDGIYGSWIIDILCNYNLATAMSSIATPTHGNSKNI